MVNIPAPRPPIQRPKKLANKVPNKGKIIINKYIFFFHFSLYNSLVIRNINPFFLRIFHFFLNNF